MQLNEVRPMLEVADLPATIAFYTETLGFRLVGTWPDEGQPTGAALRAGSVELMFTQLHAHSAAPSSIMTGQLYVYPPSVNDAWERLKDVADVAWPIDDMPYGMREFAIRDPNGYLLTFGQDVEAIDSRPT